MTTTASTPTLTLRQRPETESVEIVLENITTLRRDRSREYLERVYGVTVLPNYGEESPNIVALISTSRLDSHGSALPSTLCDRIVLAVLLAHADEGAFDTKVVDELTDRGEFFARALKAQGLRDRDELVTADTVKELQQKLDSPYAKDPYLRGRGHRKFDLPGFERDMPYRPRPSLDDDLFDLPGLAAVFGGMFGGEAFADVRRAHQQARQAEANQEEHALMRALAGTKITFEVDQDGTFHFVGEVVYNPPAEPQQD